MKDLLLDSDGDLLITNGDVTITDSVIQAIKIRLRWFAGEWRVNPDYGMPYYDDIFIKNPNKVLLEEQIREEILSVTEVTEVTSVSVSIDAKTRCATISFTVTVSDTVINGEVTLNV